MRYCIYIKPTKHQGETKMTTTYETTGDAIKAGDVVTYCGETFTAESTVYVHMAGVMMCAVAGSYPRSIGSDRAVIVRR